MHKPQQTSQPPSEELAVTLVTRRMAEFCKILSNPCRIMILEELRGGERDVSSLIDSLQVSQSTVSQQIAVLRAYKLIRERKEGRATYYSLRNPELVSWVIDGLRFSGAESRDADSVVLSGEHAESACQSGDSGA